ncbi:hypothetical protein PsorP6_015734 [Peronosclerospora sorghi]|uniref:Uncharacterized protein n=1 Tax=Peronosclerospora sorghi TaxID=230839 RepID=A0ACC0WND1_9STRA|nr:hypothetical protein PsorP6_015734 [Peronosclerospora sorghi]
MRERMGSGNSRPSEVTSRTELDDVIATCPHESSERSTKTLLPVVLSRRKGKHNDEDDNDKRGKHRRRRKLFHWLRDLRSRHLLGARLSQRKCNLMLAMLAMLVMGSLVLLTLEVAGRLRFNGYFMKQRGHNGQLGFYHEMDVNMHMLKEATRRPEGKLFPASASNPRDVKLWVAERRRRTNGHKYLVGCTSHWKGYVLRSFLSLFEELKSEHGWEELDTSKDPMKVIHDADPNQAPSVLFFCLNSFYYPMALLQQYGAYFHKLRRSGTIIAVWNDDLHYYDQFNPIILRDEILTKVDVLVGTYTYFMDDYFHKVTNVVNERDLPLTVWLPHSSGADFVNASFNEYPINKIILSGKLGSNWYPLRHWLSKYQQNHPDVMDIYHHSGYYVADNQSAIYASYLRSYRTAITTTLIFQYVIAKLFEIPSTGALLVVNRDVNPLLAALGMKEGEHYVGYDRQDPEAIIWWANDPQNWPEIDRIRRAGIDLARKHHLVTNRVKALDLFMMTGESTYQSPLALHLSSPCPSKALPNAHDLEVTYGNALAAGGGYHRVTTVEGVAAEISPHTYLWFKLSSPHVKTASDSDSTLAITQLRIGAELDGSWIKLDKCIDRHNGRFLWYQVTRFTAPTSPSIDTKQLLPLKEICVVRDLKDVPEGFEVLDEPLVSVVEDREIALRTYLCFRRLGSEDLMGSKWSIVNQKAGNWIDVKDVSSNKWSVARILTQSASEVRVHIPTWRKERDEFMSHSACRQRVAKLGTHTNVYMSPAYPLPRKQGSLWNTTMKDLQHAREQFDKYFYDHDKQKTYLPRLLIPFIEKSLLCTLPSSDLAEKMNAFHQHVLKNVVACMLGNDADRVFVFMLSLLRMILNGHSSCMFFYIKYPGSYTATKYQSLVYTSYLVNPDALAAIPTHHPCRSFYYIDNVDLFVQAGGFRLILQRLEVRDVALTEVLLYCTILNEAKPCFTQQKCRRNSSTAHRPSTVDAQTEEFFRGFLNATFARLRRMNGDELKDDDGLIDRIVGVLDLLCRDGLLLGGSRPESDIDEFTAADGSAASCDVEFAEAIEILQLDISKKIICCPYLSQRLLGISRINHFISSAERKENLQRKASVNVRRDLSSSTSGASSTTGSSQVRTSGEQLELKWLRTKYLLEWLTGSEILEVILGDRESCAKYSVQEGTHLEILKRSKTIFRFVAVHGYLTEQHIVLMWKVALSQLRSGRKTVFDILISLCGVLSADLLDVVVVLLTQVPVCDYDELIVDFIKRVIVIASKLVVDAETSGFKMTLTSLVNAASGARNKLSASAQKDVEVLNKVINLCCTLYWNAILQTDAPNESDSNSSFGLRALMRSEVEVALADSLNHLQKLCISAGTSSLVSGREQQQLLSDYLCKCAENIKLGRLVETSMSLIHRIVDGYGGGSSSSATSTLSLTRGNSFPTTSNELLKELNDTHKIVHVVVEEIKNYVVQADSENRTKSVHALAIQKRLAFLGYIVTKSDLTLPFDAVCQLWGCFDGPNSTMVERKVFFAWLTTVIPDPNNFVHRAFSRHAGFSETVVAEIFQSLIGSASTNNESALLIRLDMQTMTEESFWAIERLFRYVNTSTRRISPASIVGNAPSRNESSSKADTDLFVVEAMDLQGFETLYHVALRAESGAVSQQAMNYLIYLPLHVGSKLVRREVWADFVERCLWKLEEAMKTSNNASKTREVFRLLLLLSTFLYQSVVHSQNNKEGSFDRPEELIVNVRTQGGRVAAPFRYHFKRTSLVSELRDRIAKDTGHPADRIRIVNSSKTKLTAQGYGKFTLEKARVFGSSSANSRSAAVGSLAPTASAPSHNYVEAVLLSKVESDTIGHTNRNVLDMNGAVGVAAAAAAGLGGAGNNSSPESDWYAIKTEISGNDVWVALLFRLLSYGNGVAEEAWKVLKLLTSNEEMEKLMRSLNSVLAIDGSIRNNPSSFDWDTLLSSTCPPKLLYQLELVEQFALCSDGRLDDSDDELSVNDSSVHAVSVNDGGADQFIGAVNTWSASFIALGGRTQLEKFVLSMSPSQLLAQGTLSIMCLSKLLKLLRHFLLVESKLGHASGKSLEETTRQLVHKLLETLACLPSNEETSKEENGLNSLALTSVTSTPSAIVNDHLETLQTLSLPVYARPEIADQDNVDGIPRDSYLMTRLLSCITTYLLVAKPKTLVLLESYPGHGNIILRCLVQSSFKPVRLEAANVIAAVSATKNTDRDDRVACCNYYLRLLGEYTGSVNYQEYYNVFTLLVTRAENLTEFPILASCQILCRRIKAFKIEDEVQGLPSKGNSRKASAASDQSPQPAPDVLLEGQLSTLLVIIKRIPAVLAENLQDAPCDGRSLRETVAKTLYEQDEIIHELFHECLFATPDKQMNGRVKSGKDDDVAVEMQASSSYQYYLRQPKCRSDTCRGVAFDLLAELSIDNTDGLRYLLTEVANQHTLERPVGPTVATSTILTSKRKSPKSKDQLLQRGKYVGLKNLGCTCYLNSMIQSFFMMPRFRRQVLRLQSNQNHSDKGETVSLTYELQSLFAHLEGSAKPYYNPRLFIRALKTWDGEAVDVNVQQDASEFLTSFFQQIESETNGMNSSNGGHYTNDENILNTFFGGEFSNELVAEGNRYSERFEPFHFISVPVRDRKNLKESLDGWVEGEKVRYTWETGPDMKGKVGTGVDHEDDEKVTLETHKRISISQLPSCLIIHLKRFEFDFEKMQQIKLHDRFEFPTELDMYPYTKEGQQETRKKAAGDGTHARLSSLSDGADDGRKIAPEYSQYELVGTVVHLGTAHSGHYYSILRDQQVTGGKAQWYEFNDTMVTPFDPAQIPEECFGGEESTSAHLGGVNGSLSPEEGSSLPAKMKNRSSFMLFYTRVSSKLRVSTASAACVSFYSVVLVVAFCARLKSKASLKLAHLRSVAHVIAPEPIRQLIATENRMFWRKKYLYDTQCLNFTYNLLKSCLVGIEDVKSLAVVPRFEPVEVQFEALQVATKFVFGTLWQGGDVSKVLEWRLILQALYHADVDGCRWFLSTMEANESLLLELLVFNEHREVRELTASVLSEAIATTSNTEFEKEIGEKAPAPCRTEKKKLPASFEFMFFLIRLMPALLSVPVEHHRQYFFIMYDFVQTGRNEASFLVVNSVVGAIVALLTGLGTTQPLLQVQLKKHKSQQILKSIDLSVNILKLLSVLIRCSLPPAMDVEADAEHPLILPSNMAHDHVDLTSADHEVLLNDRFIMLLTQRANHYTKETKPLEQIVTHLCWESRSVTSAFMEKIMHGIEAEDHHDVKAYFRTLNSLLKIRDSLARERLADGLTKLVAVMASQQQYYKATETSLEMLTRLAKRHPGVTQWLRENRPSCLWMEKWLLAHRGADGYLQQRKTVLVKPNSTSSWVNVSVTSSGLLKAIDRSITKLLPRLRRLLDPEADVETFYDSDDNPHRLVGKRVRVKWAKENWYEGIVQQFNEDTYEHFVAYDDGDKRSYHMSEKLFYVVDRPPSSKPDKKKHASQPQA